MSHRRVTETAIENFDLTLRMIGDRLRASSSRFCAQLGDHQWPASHRFVFAMRACRKLRGSDGGGVGFRARGRNPARGELASDFGYVRKIAPVTVRLALAALFVAVSLSAGPLTAAAAPQGSNKSDSTPATVRVGGDVKPPLKTKNVAPVYPPIAVAAHTEGVVILEATIGTDGKVKDVKVVRSIKQLDDAAIDAVRRWEFKPTVIDGKPVQVIMTIPVNFTLT